MEEDALEVHNSAKSREYIYMYILLIGSVEWKGFQKKDARFSKTKNIPDLLSDDKEGKIMWIIDF